MSIAKEIIEAVLKKPTKAWQHSVDAIKRAIEILKETAAQEVKRESQQRRKWIDNAWGTIRTHAPKIDFEIPSRPRFYDPQDDLDKATAMAKELETFLKSKNL